MSTKASIAALTGIAPKEQRLLRSVAIVDLAQHLSQAISSATDGKTTRPPRSACAQLALQVLVVAAGLRRAALVDALALSVAQASAISSKLNSLSQGKDLAQAGALQYVRLLYHVPTAQTFLLSRRQSLWADIITLSGTALPRQQKYQPLWVDVRRTSDHPTPTLSRPDPHITSLIVSVHEAIRKEDSNELLIAPYPLLEQRGSTSDAELHIEARLVGVALAGFLLEYGAIYCLHDNSPNARPAWYHYHLRPLSAVASEVPEADVWVSPPNCLGSQSLAVYRVLCSTPRHDSFDLLSFSIPRSLSTDLDLERLHQALITTFHTRLVGAPTTGWFECGEVAVEVASVTLHQVAL